MESKTLVCDRCGMAGKFQLATDCATIQSRTIGTFRLDLCTEHAESLATDLRILNTDHVAQAIIKTVLADGQPVRLTTLRRMSGATNRYFLRRVLQPLIDAKQIALAGTTSGKTARWIGPPISTNGTPPATSPPRRRERDRPHRRKTESSAEAREAVTLALLRKTKDGCGAGEIMKATGLKKSGVRSLLQRLMVKKRVRRTGTGPRNMRYHLA